MSQHDPPRLLTWLGGCLLPERFREAILGDLAEEYLLRRRSGAFSADRWYSEQLFRSVTGTIGRRSLTTLGVAIGAFAVSAVADTVGTATVAELLPPRLHRALSVVVGFSAVVLGGYLAARIRPGAAMVLAILEAVAVTLLMVVMSCNEPVWYQVTFLILGPLAALLGGEFWRRRRLAEIAVVSAP